MRTKKIALLFYTGVLFLFSLPAVGVHFELTGKNSRTILKGEKPARINQSVGSFTMDILNEAQSQGKLNFSGSESNLFSINDLIAHSTIEGQEIKAFGWCFTIDGILPDKMPDEVFIKSNDIVLHWYFAYARSFQNTWTMCLPVNEDL